MHTHLNTLTPDIHTYTFIRKLAQRPSMEKVASIIRHLAFPCLGEIMLQPHNEVRDEVIFSELAQVKGKQGSNPGGVFKRVGWDDEKFYIKVPVWIGYIQIFSWLLSFTFVILSFWHYAIMHVGATRRRGCYL